MKNYFNLIMVLLCFNGAISQENSKKFTISGTITDAATKESLMGVNVLISKEQKGTITNEYGFYSLELTAGTYNVEVSYIGYATQIKSIELNENIRIDVSLVEESQSLDEVVVVQRKSTTSIKKPEMSIVKLDRTVIKKTPAVMGEPDLIRVIQQYPGVTTTGEASTGFHVRGGAVDQNLVILDEATLFNTSHLFGFVSVFNPDAIKDVKLFKGGIPSKYGGRAAAVLDVYQREGNALNYNFEGGIGILASKLLAEGPIVKDKSTFLLAGRGSYAHLFMNTNENPNSASFFDLNAKVSWQFNPNSKVYVSNYIGKDYFSFGEIFKNEYGNNLVNMRWNYIFNTKLFSNLSAVYSNYHYKLDLESGGFSWLTGIDNSNLKYDFKYYKSDSIQFNFGAQMQQYWFNPGEIKPTSESSGANYLKLEKRKALENAVYVDVETKFSDNLSMMFGTRLSSFLRIGGQTYNTYADNNPVVYNQEFDFYEKATPTGTIKYKSGEIIKSYANLEPRLALNYNWKDQAFKFSFNRMAQYIHMLSNTLSPTPLDIWTPSDQFIKPQIADQVAVGYVKNVNENQYTFEIESYFKKVKNRINYIDGADLIANEAVEQIILNGEERAYGMELLVKKNKGNFTGWLSYTLSKAEQRTPGRNLDEPGINNGNWYRANHDRRHNLAITTNYELNKRWSFGANFNFQSGRATTYPEGYFDYLDAQFPIFNERNKASLPAYHRLDLSATYVPKKNENRKFQSEWNFSIYNVYNRENANSMTFRQNEQGVNESTQLSIFGIIPSITYSFKF